MSLRLTVRSILHRIGLAPSSVAGVSPVLLSQTSIDANV